VFGAVAPIFYGLVLSMPIEQRQCQVWFTLEGKSLWGWLGNILSMETLYKELSDVDFLEQPWLQLICCTIYLLCGYNFRRWNKV